MNQEPSAEKDTPTITMPKPQIFTGPRHQTVDEATVSYLREAAERVRINRYWGSGVTALVASVLDAAATAIECPTPPAETDDWACRQYGYHQRATRHNREQCRVAQSEETE